jgi:hypothetical protein
MKYIKTFENYKVIGFEDYFPTYWILRNDNNLKQNLKDIGCDWYEEFYDIIKDNISDDIKYIFIYYEYKIDGDNSLSNWTWDEYEEVVDPDDIYKSKGVYNFKFGGCVNIEDFEVELSANKYNL